MQNREFNISTGINREHKAQCHSTASNRLIQCIPLVNMPDIHLLSMILSNFHRLSCLLYWCDRFETLHDYYWSGYWYNGQPIVCISQFMKMQPEYHFKFYYGILCDFFFTVPEGGGRLWFLLPVLLVVGTAVLVALMLVWKMRLIQPVEVSYHNFLLCSKWDRTGLFLISIGARYLYITAGNRNYLKLSFRRSKSITRFNW